MYDKSFERYKIYEYMRDSDTITAEMSNTKKLIIKLMNNDKETEKYCYRKMEEEKKEVEEATIGEHFHENMTKREILVNEISQYIYWQTIIAISKFTTYEDFDVESKINEIIEKIDITKIGETKPITLEETISRDLEQMKSKEYLKEVI